MLIILLLVSHSNSLFVPCGRLSWLPVSFLLHVKYPLSYRIVFYSNFPAMLMVNKDVHYNGTQYCSTERSVNIPVHSHQHNISDVAIGQVE